MRKRWIACAAALCLAVGCMPMASAAVEYDEAKGVFTDDFNDTTASAPYWSSRVNFDWWSAPGISDGMLKSNSDNSHNAYYSYSEMKLNNVVFGDVSYKLAFDLNFKKGSNLQYGSGAEECSVFRMIFQGNHRGSPNWDYSGYSLRISAKEKDSSGMAAGVSLFKGYETDNGPYVNKEGTYFKAVSGETVYAGLNAGMSDGEFVPYRVEIEVDREQSRIVVSMSENGGEMTKLFDVTDAEMLPAGTLVFHNQWSAYQIDNLSITPIEKGEEPIVSVAPVGVSAQASDTQATLRFSSAVTGDGATAAGAVLLPLWIFDTDETSDQAATVTINKVVADGETFGIDVTNIPASQFGTVVVAKPFVMANGTQVWAAETAQSSVEDSLK